MRDTYSGAGHIVTGSWSSPSSVGESIAYLAFHLQGATAKKSADNSSIAASRAHTDVSALRDWLGTNARTKTLYLPVAKESPPRSQYRIKT